MGSYRVPSSSRALKCKALCQAFQRSGLKKASDRKPEVERPESCHSTYGTAISKILGMEGMLGDAYELGCLFLTRAW